MRTTMPPELVTSRLTCGEGGARGRARIVAETPMAPWLDWASAPGATRSVTANAAGSEGTEERMPVAG